MSYEIYPESDITQTNRQLTEPVRPSKEPDYEPKVIKELRKKGYVLEIPNPYERQWNSKRNPI